MQCGHKSVALGVGATVLTLGLAACASGTGQQPRSAHVPQPRETRARPATPRPTPATSPVVDSTPVDAPSSTTTAAAASPTPAPKAAPRTSLEQRLLTAAELPGFSEGFTWQSAGTRGQEGQVPVGTCHKFPMTSIGALRVVVRRFSPSDGSAADTASELVAEFPDPMTAIRAFEVLKSWRGQCDQQLSGYDRHRIGDLQHVDVEHGRAGWYLLSYGPPEGGGEDEGWFDSQGFTRVGRRIAALQMRTLGQDFSYPPGQEPMVEAVQSAARRLR